MLLQRAAELLSELSVGNARVSVTDPDESGMATVALRLYQGGELVTEKAQSVRLLPRDCAIDEQRYRAFVQGVGLALRSRNVESVMPADLVIANLLRVPTLQEPDDFARCLKDRALRCEVLADMEVTDYVRERGLIPPGRHARNLWILMNPEDHEEALAAARELVAADAVDAIGTLLAMMEGWQARMWCTGGISWVTEDDENVDVMLALVLEPLLRKGSPPELRQLSALEVVGMFDPEHVTARGPWMFET